MSIGGILFLAMAFAAFLSFAGVLAWAAHKTSH